MSQSEKKEEALQFGENMKILVADDMQSARESLVSMLRGMGFTDISEANDGIQALTALKKEKYDCIITDWNMPNMDGLSLVRFIRIDPAIKDLIVIMVTAQADRERVIEAIKVGITDYIVKPFTESTLREKLERIIEKRNGLNK